MNKKLRKKTAQGLLLMVTCSFGSTQRCAAEPSSTSTSTSTFTCAKAIDDCPKGDKKCFQDLALSGSCATNSDPKKCAEKAGEDDAQRFEDEKCDQGVAPKQQQNDLAKVGAVVGIAAGGVGAVTDAVGLGTKIHGMTKKKPSDEEEKENKTSEGQKNKRPKREDTRGAEEPAALKSTPYKRHPALPAVRPTTDPIQHPTSHTSEKEEIGEAQKNQDNYNPHKQASPAPPSNPHQFNRPQPKAKVE